MQCSIFLSDEVFIFVGVGGVGGGKKIQDQGDPAVGSLSLLFFFFME